MVQAEKTEKTNAETQTALRGVAILEGECGHAHTTSFGHAHFSGSSPRVHEEAVFFTECECKLQSSKSTSKNNISGSATTAKVGVANLSNTPVLPCVAAQACGRGNNKHHSTSTPDVATLVPKPASSRRDCQTTVGFFSSFGISFFSEYCQLKSRHVERMAIDKKPHFLSDPHENW